jgi:integrase
MSLELYRRHNPQKCSSTDTVVCTNRRRPCSIWVSGKKPDGTYVRESLKTRDWKHAEKIMRYWEEQGQKPKTASGPVRIEDFKKLFIDNAKAEGKGHETIRKYEQLFKQMDTFTANKGIRFVPEFDLALLEEFRSTWPDGDLSKQKKQERLRTVLKYAYSRKMIERNPALELGRIVVKLKQVAPFTDDEMKAIESAAKARIEDETRSKGERERSKQAYALILLMRYSGLRISDATMLSVDKLVNNRLSLRTQKSGKDISVLLPPPVIDAMEVIKPVSKTHYFWDGAVTLKSLTNLYRDFYLAPVFKAAKLTGNPHPHQFRHTFASKLLSSGTSVENVAALLGNTPKIVWKHYAAWVKERQEALDEAVLVANGYHQPERAVYKSRTKSTRRRKPSRKPNKTGYFDGGGGGIRTHETLSGLTVFKTAAFNRSATPPKIKSLLHCSLGTASVTVLDAPELLRRTLLRIHRDRF